MTWLGRRVARGGRGRAEGMTRLLRVALAAAAGGASAGTLSGSRTAPSVAYWNASAATAAESLSFEAQAVAFALQGIVNARSEAFPALYLSAGYVELWPGEDDWWASQLRQRRGLSFAPVVEPTLCALVAQFEHRLAGAVAYDTDDYSLAFALTLAGQRRLLPVSDAVLAKHSCLRALPIKADLRGQFRQGRAAAWRWAMAELLPNSSKTLVYNLNRYRYPGTPPEPKKGSAASGLDTLIDVDFVRHPTPTRTRPF